MQETEAFAVLNAMPTLGAVRIRQLVHHFGSAVDALQAPVEKIRQLPGYSQVLPHWAQWQKNQDWRNDLALANKLGVQLFPFTDPLFPKPLLKIADHPALLYVKGELKPQDQRSLAIVGTRHASIYGSEMAEQIGKEAAGSGFTIISGLARGIDTAAHRGALKQGRTLAVIGSGLADIYPPENRSLADQITQNGALISEFSMRTPPDRKNFPQRNRIVSGMFLGAVLIEAPVKSGAMITMEKAFQHQKKLFALPGRADHENFRGNHFLIKSGKAQLIENAEDVVRSFEDLFSFSHPVKHSEHSSAFDKNEQALLAAMPPREIGIDALAQISQLAIPQVHAALMGLVLKKAVKEFPGKQYKKLLFPPS